MMKRRWMEKIKGCEIIKYTRRERGKTVGIQCSNGRWMKEGGLWKEWKEQIRETAESNEHTRIKGGDRVGVKINERGD